MSNMNGLLLCENHLMKAISQAKQSISQENQELRQENQELTEQIQELAQEYRVVLEQDDEMTSQAKQSVPQENQTFSQENDENLEYLSSQENVDGSPEHEATSTTACSECTTTTTTLLTNDVVCDEDDHQALIVSVERDVGGDHEINLIDSVDWREEIYNLTKESKLQQREREKRLEQIENSQRYLDAMREKIREKIIERADLLTRMIFERRENLLKELDKEYSSCSAYYDGWRGKVTEELDGCKESIEFADAAVTGDGTVSESDALKLREDVTLRQKNGSDDRAPMQILSLNIEIPENGREESHLTRLFGFLVRGNVSCENVELVMSSHIDLQWPTCSVSTASRRRVVAGKSGAFANEGKLFVYDGHGSLVGGRVLERDSVPVDMVSIDAGKFLVSDNHGNIFVFAGSGDVLDVWTGKFEGSAGYMTLADQGRNVWVTSSKETGRLRKYKCSNGERVATLQLSLPSSSCDRPPFDIHKIASDSDGNIVVSGLDSGNVYVFDASGSLVLRYPPVDDENDGVERSRCLSAICCDSFNNILVADFTNDSIDVIARTGHFLGRLLTKKNGIACPSCISIDHDGHLCVGQYGGQVLVFRYLSLKRQV